MARKKGWTEGEGLPGGGGQQINLPHGQEGPKVKEQKQKKDTIKIVGKENGTSGCQSLKGGQRRGKKKMKKITAEKRRIRPAKQKKKITGLTKRKQEFWKNSRKGSGGKKKRTMLRLKNVKETPRSPYRGAVHGRGGGEKKI